MARWYYILLLLIFTIPVRAAEELHDSHEESDPAWRIKTPKSGVRVVSHHRQSSLVKRGRQSERIDLYASQDGLNVYFEYSIPPSQSIEDLHAVVSTLR